MVWQSMSLSWSTTGECTGGNIKMEQLRQLSTELGNPGVQPLWLAARRNGIKVMKRDVEAFVKQKGEKQVLSAIQPSKGKTVSESLDARWQMDLAFGVAAEGYTAYLVAVNVFDRFTYALPQSLIHIGRCRRRG